MKTFILGILIASLVWIGVIELKETSEPIGYLTTTIILTANNSGLFYKGFLDTVEVTGNYTYTNPHIYEYLEDGYAKGITFREWSENLR